MTNPKVIKDLPPELKDEFSKVKFDPISTRDNQITMNGTKRVTERIIKILVEEEIERRVGSLQKGFTLLNKLRDEYVNIKPDIGSTFSEDMVESKPTYSKEQAMKKKKTFSDIVNLIISINKASEDGEYDQLDKLIK